MYVCVIEKQRKKKTRERERIRERGRDYLVSPPGGLILMTSSNSNFLPKGPFPNTITLEFKASIYEWGGSVN